MRWFARIATLGILLIAPFGFSRPAFACSCAMSTVQEAYAQASFVFTGRVTQIVPSWTADTTILSSADPVYVTFTPITFWKGTPYTSMIVATANDGVSCGYGFTVGETYLVYTYQNGIMPETSLCSRTVPLIDGHADIRSLGAGLAPREPLPDAVVALVPTATVPRVSAYPSASVGSSYPVPSPFERTPVRAPYPILLPGTSMMPFLTVALLLLVSGGVWMLWRSTKQNRR